MAFQVSPGVAVKEIDLTNVIPAVSTSIGGFAGRFRWGPINEVSLISSENELANKFGKPNSTYARGFFEAASFLQYGNALKVVRAEEALVMNASSGFAQNSLKSLTVDAEGSPNLGLYGIADGDDILDNFVMTSTAGTAATLDNPLYSVDTIAIGNADGSGYSGEDVVEFSIGGKTLQVEIDTVDNDSPEASPISSGVGTAATISLTSASASEKFTVSALKNITAAGMTNIATTATGTVTGSGLTVTVTFKLVSISITDPGSSLNGGTYVFTATKQDSSATSVTVTDGLTTTLAGGSEIDSTLIRNDEHFDSIESDLSDDIYSRYAGLLGNKTRIYILNSANFTNSFTGADGNSFAAADNFDGAPDASTEIHILVTTTAREFTGDNSEATELVVETWPFLGVSSTAKSADGSNNFYADVINSRSEWIYIPSGSGAISNVATLTSSQGTFELSAGLDGGTRNNGMINTALDLLSDAETEDVNLLFSETDSDDDATVSNKVLDIAKARKDAVGFVSPPVAPGTTDNPN